jgi:hypothetical protein
MKLINADRLIEGKGFFIEDERGCIMCVVSAQDIRNAPAVDLVPLVPGHDDQHNISEMSYKNGYAKGCEDTEKKYTAMKEELEFTRKFIHSQGLEFAIISEWRKAGKSEPAAEEKRGHWIIRSYGHGDNATNWAECSECHVCGSPQWKVCPVCETKMVASNGDK